MSDKAAKYFLIPKLPLWPNISKSKRLSKVLPLLDPNKRNENIGSKCFSPQLSTSCWSWLLAACRQFENSSWPLKPHCFANVRCSGASPSPGGGGDPSDVEIALDVVRLVGCFDSCEAIVHSELSSGQRQTWNFWIPLAHLQNWLSLTSRRRVWFGPIDPNSGAVFKCMKHFSEVLMTLPRVLFLLITKNWPAFKEQWDLKPASHSTPCFIPGRWRSDRKYRPSWFLLDPSYGTRRLTNRMWSSSFFIDSDSVSAIGTGTGKTGTD